MEVKDLSSIQVEADTRIFLHAKHAADNGVQSICIKSSDTDVEVLACYFQQYILIFPFSFSPGQASDHDLSIFQKSVRNLDVELVLHYQVSMPLLDATQSVHLLVKGKLNRLAY